MLQDSVSKICVTLLLVAVLVVVALLAWHGTLTGSQVMGTLGIVVGLPATLFGAHAVALAASGNSPATVGAKHRLPTE